MKAVNFLFKTDNDVSTFLLRVLLGVSGIIGPAIGGVLLRFVSPDAVFGMNSLCPAAAH
jgi:hypothetical protein